MKGWFRVFEFSQREQKGIWMLVTLIILSYVGFHLYDDFFDESIENFSKEEFDKVASKLNPNEKENQIENITEIELFEFDANKIGFDSLLSLGFSEPLSKRYVKFREAIGGFKSVDDIKKVYGLNDSIFRAIESYIVIQASDTSMAENSNLRVNENSKTNDLPNKDQVVTKRYSSELIIELNSASADELRKIKGIGETLSNRIIKYRDAIGGFYKANQIFNVYGVDSVGLDLENVTFKIDTALITRVDINKGEASDLANHLFISSYQAKILIAYRKQHGDFRSKLDVAASKAFTDEELQVVLPYLAIK